ncbi:hypothetical protein AAFF_G00422810 [Aldrovandia affinis]|uniref:HAT C-terminal dimerisation domain-containing protein n=1 Tax=Aldrovandia affinis TaxID=143900 RepID=A0AAD7WZC3_9TELE|nr:hypothetical protein AAFF_G00422810 [Aldrovandia affinis]
MKACWPHRHEEVPEGINEGLELYLREAVIDRKTGNSPEWWNQNSGHFKELFVQARCHLAIPSSSVPSTLSRRACPPVARHGAERWHLPLPEHRLRGAKTWALWISAEEKIQWEAAQIVPGARRSDAKPDLAGEVVPAGPDKLVSLGWHVFAGPICYLHALWTNRGLWSPVPSTARRLPRSWCAASAAVEN